MKLYLVQHGEAKSKEQDPDCSLTDNGIKQTKKIASWFGKQALPVSEIYHSLKKRADQTAEIFENRLAPSNGVNAMAGLKPNDDVLPIAEKLEETSEPLMIVGHLPFLNRLASFLVAGEQEPGIISFTNSGVVCLDRQNDSWAVAWIMVPDMLPDHPEV